MTLHYKTFEHPKPHFFAWHTVAHKIMSYQVWHHLMNPHLGNINQTRGFIRIVWNGSYEEVVTNQ